VRCAYSYGTLWLIAQRVAPPLLAVPEGTSSIREGLLHVQPTGARAAAPPRKRTCFQMVPQVGYLWRKQLCKLSTARVSRDPLQRQLESSARDISGCHLDRPYPLGRG
jgi:hypothetical protein